MPFPVPNGKRTFLDLNGDPLAAGQVFFYVPGTSDPSPTYADEGMTVPNTNPVILDQAGRAVIWGDGLYREVVYDLFGNLIWDQTTGIVIDKIPGNLEIVGNLTVDGNSQFNGSVNVSGPFSATDGATISGGLNTDNINNSGTITTNNLTASGTITTNDLTANGTTTINGPFSIPAGFTGNIVAQPGSCVVTNCIESNGAQYISVNANLYVTQQANGALEAMIIQSPDPQSYSDFYGRGILIVSNDNPYIALFNTFGPFLPWVMWGGVAAFNWGLSNANNGDPSVAGSTELMSLDDAGNLTIIGTLTQGGAATDGASAPMTADALPMVLGTPVKTLPHLGIAQSDAPPQSRASAGAGVSSDVLLAILWKAVQELAALVPGNP